MLSPLHLYVAGILLLFMLVLVRLLRGRDSGGWFFAAAAAAAIESGLLTEFGLLLPSGVLLVLLGLRYQLVASALVLAVNALVAWLLFRAIAGHGHGRAQHA